MIDEEEFSLIVEWLLVSAVKYFAEDNVNLEAKLYRNIQALTLQTASMYSNPRVDTLVAAALIEQLYLVKYSIFNTHTGL